MSSPPPSPMRVAGLCIGVDKYPKFGNLQNAVKDATSVNAKLNSTPFCTSTVMLPKDKIGLWGGIRQRLQAVKQNPPDLFLLYYAGHGIQQGAKGTVYLVPGTANPVDEEDCRVHCLSLDDVLRICHKDLDEPLRRRWKKDVLFLIVIDACRSPLASDRGPISRKSLSCGPGMDDTNTPFKTAIYYSCSRGKTASDGEAQDEHSPFASTLLDLKLGIFTPGLQLQTAISNVTRTLKSLAGHEQDSTSEGLDNIPSDFCIVDAPPSATIKGLLLKTTQVNEEVWTMLKSFNLEGCASVLANKRVSDMQDLQEVNENDARKWNLPHKFRSLLKYLAQQKSEGRTEEEKTKTQDGKQEKKKKKKYSDENQGKESSKTHEQELKNGNQVEEPKKKEKKNKASGGNKKNSEEEMAEEMDGDSWPDYPLGRTVLTINDQPIDLQAGGVLPREVDRLCRKELKTKIDVMEQENDVLAIKTVMCTHNKNGGVQEEALRALDRLALNDEHLQQISDEGGIELIVSTMTVHLRIAGVQQWACAVLERLCCKAEYFEKTSNSKGIESVLGAMRGHPEESGVQEHGCMVLYRLAYNANIQGRITGLGGIYAVLVAMEKHKNRPGVQEWACAALSSLAFDDNDNQKEIGKRGILNVLTAMEKHTKKGEVQIYACLALCNLAGTEEAVCEENQATIAEEGGIESVIRCMQHHRAAAQLQVEACDALHNLAVHHSENKTRIARSDAIEQVLEAMKLHIKESSVQSSGLSALWVCCEDSATVQSKVAKSEGIHQVHETMRVHRNEPKLQALGIRVLRCIELKLWPSRMIKDIHKLVALVVALDASAFTSSDNSAVAQELKSLQEEGSKLLSALDDFQGKRFMTLIQKWQCIGI